MKFEVISPETFDVVESFESDSLTTATETGKAKHGQAFIVRTAPDQPVEVPVNVPLPVATNESRPATNNEGTMTENTTPTVTKPAKAKKEPKAPSACWCGCGGLTGGKFVPGHDARFHGAAKRHARAIAAGENPEEPVFVNADAKADWDKWANAELPKAKKAVEEAARKAAAKAAAKAEKAPANPPAPVAETPKETTETATEPATTLAV